MAGVESNLIQATSVRAHFSDALCNATRNQDVALRDITATYLINLLTEFCSASSLRPVSDDCGHLKPLALLYGEALEAPSAEQRRRVLQRLGDIALFIAGIFSDSLARRTVDLDYYIGMGGAAYGYLHDCLASDGRVSVIGDPFEELGEKFALLVDVLAEISEMSGLKSNSDVLRSYEVWLKTRSLRARRQLARAGIVPHPASFGTSH